MDENDSTVRPCKKCGGTDRVRTSGRCRQCMRANNGTPPGSERPPQEKKVVGPRPCTKCGACDRLANGKCRPCGISYRASLLATPRPCMKCGVTDRYKSGECRPCLNASRVALAASTKPCPRCGSSNRNAKGGCRTCAVAYAKRRRSTPEGRKAMNDAKDRYAAKPGVAEGAAIRQRCKNYGISRDEHDRMMFEQKGLCGCCGDLLSPGHGTQLDHDHATGAVRGFLCRRCNLALGLVDDSPLRLRKLLAYLDRHRPRLPFVR
jgi:hypothetical protein